MGHREVRRVPLDFNWPQGEVWEGFLMPDRFGETPCTEAKAWQPAGPPTGDGWQLWETVTEGSPASPVFASAGELAAWCEGNATVFADTRWTAEQWLASFVNDTTSVDSLAFGSPGRGLHVGDPLSHSAS